MKKEGNISRAGAMTTALVMVSTRCSIAPLCVHGVLRCDLHAVLSVMQPLLFLLFLQRSFEPARSACEICKCSYSVCRNILGVLFLVDFTLQLLFISIR